MILGACDPDPAARALDIDRSIGVLLLCNVVVSGGDGGSIIRILDPLLMAAVMGREELQPVAQEAARRLQIVLDRLPADRAGQAACRSCWTGCLQIVLDRLLSTAVQ